MAHRGVESAAELERRMREIQAQLLAAQSREREWQQEEMRAQELMELDMMPQHDYARFTNDINIQLGRVAGLVARGERRFPTIEIEGPIVLAHLFFNAVGTLRQQNISVRFVAVQPVADAPDMFRYTAIAHHRNVPLRRRARRSASPFDAQEDMSKRGRRDGGADDGQQEQPGED